MDRLLPITKAWIVPSILFLVKKLLGLLFSNTVSRRTRVMRLSLLGSLLAVPSKSSLSEIVCENVRE